MPLRTSARPARRTASAPATLPFVRAMIASASTDLRAGRPAAALAGLAALAPHEVHPADAATVAMLLAGAGAKARAIAWFDHALSLAPREPSLLAGRARALAALGRVDGALAACALAAAAGSDDPDLYLAQGHLLRAAGRRDEAIAAYDTALRLRPACPEALRAGGALLAEAGHAEAALRFLDEAARLAPDDRGTLIERTNLLQGLGRFAEAIAAYDAALGRQPGRADLRVNRGIALQETGRLAEARADFEAAVALDPSLAQAWLNLGNALVWFGEPAAAIEAFDRALALRAAYPEALCGRGAAAKLLARFDAALADFDAALALRPDFPHARANRGELRLLHGDLRGGWPDYEAQFRAGRQTRPVLRQSVPQWSGADRPGMRLAVLADQGNGDIIHFARYLPALAARGLDVTFLCAARLQRLLRGVTGAARVTDSIAAEEAFDAQIALSSLPHAFRTALDTIPGRLPYLFAEPELVARWAPRVGVAGFRIGLCWRGSQHWQADPRRSLPLAALAPLAEVPGVRLLSLQLPDNTGDARDAAAALRLDPLGAELDRGPDSFVDTAAVMANLDLVVTCDTSIAHLAGALGRPVFVLLQAIPEWRWMLGRGDSPWYPSMRLFRQAVAGDWTAPIAAVAGAVRAFETPSPALRDKGSPPGCCSAPRSG